MKNQYLGDVGDFGKYGLLRFLKASGFEIGVNWYLTPDDGRTDGCHTEYLSDGRMRVYDPDLYDAMGRIAFRKDKSVQMVEVSGILSGVCFYHGMMDFSPLRWRDRPKARASWHQRALEKLAGAELVFLDPDNGLSVKQRPTGKNAQKYVLPNEVADYFKRGQQVMYYHHRPRKSEAEWLADKRLMSTYLPDARLLAISFRRWGVRTYVFVVHEEQFERYSQVLGRFLGSSWGSLPVDGRVPFILESV